MITVNKANPTPGEITSSLTGSTGDGAGLHFDGAAGAVTFTPVNLGTKFTFELVVKADSYADPVVKIVDFDDSGSSGRFTFGTAAATSYNLGIYDNSDWVSFGVKVLDDLKVHHLTLTVDGTAAYLYDNGNQVATATISASHNLDAVTNAAIAANYSGSANFFAATYYRCRFYNKALTSSEVQTAFERSDVDYADQYGEQNLVDAAASAFTSGTYSWVAYGTNAIANVSNNLTITYGNNEQGAYNYLRDSSDLNQDLVVGKKYRLRITAKYTGGSSGVQFELYNGATLDSLGALTTSFAEYVHEFTAGSGAASAYLRLDGLATGNVVTIDTWQVDEIGCVSDYDLAFANENQSRMVADRSTNNVDGDMSSSGVKQTQVIKQLNSTALAVGGSALTDTLAGFTDSQAAIVGGDNVGLALQSTHSGKTSRIRFFRHDGDQDATVGLDNTNGNLFMGTGASAHFTIDSTGSATFSGDTKIGDGLVSNYVKHVAGLDDTVAISFTFPSQSSRYIHQMLELRVAMGDDGAATATPTFLRYAFTTLTTASGITQMDASLGTGITVATGASGTTLTVTLTEGSGIAMDSVTVFATVTSGHGDAKCTGMTVA